MEKENADKSQDDSSVSRVSRGRMSTFEKIKKVVKTFPKKRHIEYISALLSIPVLLSVITLNYLNIENKNKSTSTSPAPTQSAPIIIEKNSTIVPSISETIPTAPVISQTECIKKIGSISINFPEDNQTVSDNPLCFVIDYTDSDYCSVVWSYKINSDSWSNYSSNAPCIYNLPQGDNVFYLRVQSTADQAQQETLIRNFTYTSSGASIITPTATITPTPTLE